MKAMLLIDMPKSCDGCPCEYDYIRCKVTGKFPDYDKRPKWCPLKPIPINEDDIEVAERYNQLVNGIIDKMLEDLKRTKEE